jgi:hypothetical protein
LHGLVNRANDPHRELMKFKWMRDHKIISDAEYQASVAEVRAIHDPNSRESLGEERQIHRTFN